MHASVNHLTATTRRRTLPAPRGQGPLLTVPQYRELFGWAVEHQLGRAVLCFGHDIVGVRVPEKVATKVAGTLGREDSQGPVLLLLDGASWVFLADANGLLVADDRLPAGISVLGCPARIPIPAVGARHCGTRWAVPPDPGCRWLPTLAAVVSAVHRSVDTVVGADPPTQAAC